MALYHRSSEKRRIFNDFRRQEEEVIGSLVSRLSNRPTSPKTQMEQEKRIRREIANSNERRRMQSINAGFQSLRTLLPHHDGEKLSKAAILQHTAEYIYQLEQEKTRLLSQNSQLKRLLNSQMSQDSDGSSSDSPLPKRKKGDTMDDEGIAGMSPQDAESKEDTSPEMLELRMQLDRERRLRMMLEEQSRNLETKLCPDRLREVPQPNLHQKVKAEPQEGAEPAKGISTSPENVVTVAHTDHLPSSLGPPFPQVALPHNPQHQVLPAAVESPPPTHPASPSESLPPAPSPVPDLPQDLSTHAAPSSVKEESQSPCASPYHASTSRQNLETIVEAIRHLEGDHLFRDDEPLLVPRSSADEGVLRNGLNVVVVHEAALRQHIIQCGTSMPTQQSRRPGVIVANHS